MHTVIQIQSSDLERMFRLTHGAVGGEVGLDGGCIIQRDPLVVAGGHPEGRSPVGPQGEVDHCPAAEETEEEEGEGEEQTPGLAEEAAAAAGAGGEGGPGLLRLGSECLRGGTVQGLGRGRQGAFLVPFHFSSRVPFFLSLRVHAPLTPEHPGGRRRLRGGRVLPLLRRLQPDSHED